MKEGKKLVDLKCRDISGNEFMIKDIVDWDSTDNILKIKDINNKHISVNFNNIIYIVAEKSDNES